MRCASLASYSNESHSSVYLPSSYQTSNFETKRKANALEPPRPAHALDQRHLGSALVLNNPSVLALSFKHREGSHNISTIGHPMPSSGCGDNAPSFRRHLAAFSLSSTRPSRTLASLPQDPQNSLSSDLVPQVSSFGESTRHLSRRRKELEPRQAKAHDTSSGRGRGRESDRPSNGRAVSASRD